MAGSTLVFTRELDLPRTIVWDALVDDVLVSGWLAEATIEPWLGGRYDLVWMHPDPLPPTNGRIVALQHPSLLTVSTVGGGSLSFELDELPGGPRGMSTRLRVTVVVDTEPAFATMVKAYWLTDLDQLQSLLRGHPVDWRNWSRDHLEAWRSHLHAVEQGTA